MIYLIILLFFVCLLLSYRLYRLEKDFYYVARKLNEINGSVVELQEHGFTDYYELLSVIEKAEGLLNEVGKHEEKN